MTLIKQQDEPVTSVDATGLKCPLPLLRAKQALAGVRRGQVVEVLTTDAGSVKDMHAFTDLSSHELVAFSQIGEVYKYRIKKGDQINSKGVSM